MKRKVFLSDMNLPYQCFFYGDRFEFCYQDTHFNYTLRNKELKIINMNELNDGLLTVLHSIFKIKDMKFYAKKYRKHYAIYPVLRYFIPTRKFLFFETKTEELEFEYLSWLSKQNYSPAFDLILLDEYFRNKLPDNVINYSFEKTMRE